MKVELFLSKTTHSSLQKFIVYPSLYSSLILIKLATRPLTSLTSCRFGRLGLSILHFPKILPLTPSLKVPLHSFNYEK